MANVSFTDDQFRELLGALSNRDARDSALARKSGSFATCTARYDGSRDITVVEAFLSTISTFKKIESITDEHAIEGLTLLLVGDASIWWLGVKSTITTWHEATSLLRSTFAPARPAYRIYDDIVMDKQKTPSGTELFVAKKRALMAELPKPFLLQSQCLDLLYTSLHIHVRDRIPRDTVETFDDFLGKARQLEEIVAERSARNDETTPTVKRQRCTFCRAFGHNEKECRKKAVKGELKETEEPTKPITRPGPKITCYGCGEPGVVRSKCPKCSKSKVGAVEVGFYALSPTTVASTARSRPTLKITIEGVKGQAHIDTGAKLSVASTTLYRVLQNKGIKFKSENATVTLADGLRRRQQIQSAMVPVSLCGRIIPTNFIVLPESHDNRTLLGCDFLEDANMALNVPQRLFHFLDDPGRKYDLYPEEEDGAPVSTVQTEPGTTESVFEKLAKMTSLEPIVSPMLMTPSPPSYPYEETQMEDSYGPPPLIEFYTPPQSPSRMEPTLAGYSPRFVGSLFRDAQSSINSAEVTLSPESNALFGPSIDLATIALRNGC
ncbi:hypothetical protein PYW08_005379 [Mythimna loreyi]|uniref:Uncharacterized protein n=1 Tax=Mythimna loreyi TaxID=667449 RepID=A0ACC2QH16_9NEOP|nr:hypothetical protein PYW08_005379 [Mythimna loreyi]